MPAWLAFVLIVAALLLVAWTASSWRQPSRRRLRQRGLRLLKVGPQAPFRSLVHPRGAIYDRRDHRDREVLEEVEPAVRVQRSGTDRRSGEDPRKENGGVWNAFGLILPASGGRRMP